MKNQKKLHNFQVSAVTWHEISEVGMPPRSLHFTQGEIERVFLLRGEWSIFTGYAYKDGSGFDGGENPDTVRAWAIIDGF